MCYKILLFKNTKKSVLKNSAKNTKKSVLKNSVKNTKNLC